MKWFGREESSNVEDRRGMGGRGIAVGGGGAIVIALIAWFLGIDTSRLPIPTERPSATQAQSTDPAEDKLASFTKVVFRDTEIVWGDRFERLGKTYRQPKLVIYSSVVHSACGTAQSAVGPFYCSADAKVYIDLSFYRDMERKLNAPGDLARAYVVAHEVGHHVQRLLGYTQQMENHNFSGRSGKNPASVAMELQADFLAGIWAHDAQEKFRYLEEGDVATALNAAFQIGDDRLQKRSQGYVVSDSFTHGSSKQRVEAFRSGFETGDLRLADRFTNAPSESDKTDPLAE